MKRNENVPLATEIIRKQFGIIVFLILALIGTNTFWIIKHFEEEYETVTEEITEETIVDSDGGGMATYLENSESGDIINGKDN